MNFRDYQKLSERTMKRSGNNSIDLFHMVTGVMSEWEEFVDATDEINRQEELCDMMWYIANYCTLRGLKLEDFPTQVLVDLEVKAEHVPYYTSKFADIIKKHCIYGKAIDENKELEILRGLVFTISQLAGVENLQKGLERNIEKLKVRYPEKYTDVLALNRDLENERQTLEK